MTTDDRFDFSKFFDDDRGNDDEIMRHCDRLEIKLYNYNGKVEAEYAVKGTLCATEDDDGEVVEGANLDLLRKLLERFERQNAE